MYQIERVRSVLLTSLLPLAVFAGAALGQPACDFDADGACTRADMDQLSEQVIQFRGLAPESPEFDLDQNGVLGLGDRDQWLLSAGLENGFGQAYLLGDLNLDGAVSSADLMQLAVNWNKHGSIDTPRDFTHYPEGDIDMDNYVGARDMNQIALRWQDEIVPPAAAAVLTVPEPSSVLLVLAALLGVGRRLCRSASSARSSHDRYSSHHHPIASLAILCGLLTWGLVDPSLGQASDFAPIDNWGSTDNTPESDRPKGLRSEPVFWALSHLEMLKNDAD